MYFSLTLDGDMNLFGPLSSSYFTLHNKQLESTGISNNRKIDNRTVCHGNLLTVNV